MQPTSGAVQSQGNAEDKDIGETSQPAETEGDAEDKEVGENSQPAETEGDAVNKEVRGTSQPDETEVNALNKEIGATSQPPKVQGDAEDNGVEDASHPAENKNMDVSIGGSSIPRTEETQTQKSNSTTKRTMELTKMCKIAKDPLAKVEVEFTELGEHAGNISVTLSSFFGPLVREHVPVLLDDWRKLDDLIRDTLWEEIKAYCICIYNTAHLLFMDVFI